MSTPRVQEPHAVSTFRGQSLRRSRGWPVPSGVPDRTELGTGSSLLPGQPFPFVPESPTGRSSLSRPVVGRVWAFPVPSTGTVSKHTSWFELDDVFDEKVDVLRTGKTAKGTNVDRGRLEGQEKKQAGEPADVASKEGLGLGCWARNVLAGMVAEGRLISVSPIKNHLACIGASLAFSIGVLYTNVTIGGSHHVHPLIFNLYRQLCASLILLAASQEVESIKPDRKDLPQLLLLGFLLFLDQIGFMSDMAHKGGLPSICLHAAVPAITAILALLFKVEQLSWSRMLATTVVVAGALMVSIGSTGASAIDGGTSTGAMYSLGSSVAQAGYLLLLKRIVARYPPLSTTAWAFLVSSLWTTVVAATAVPFGKQWMLPRKATGPLAYWALIGSCCVYVLYGIACKAMLSTQVALYGSLIPVAGLLFALRIIDYVPVWSFAGVLLVVSGIAWSFGSRSTSKVTAMSLEKDEEA